MVSLVLLNWIYLKVMQNPGGSTAAAVYASESAGVNPTFDLCYCASRVPAKAHRSGRVFKMVVDNPPIPTLTTQCTSPMKVAKRSMCWS